MHGEEASLRSLHLVSVPVDSNRLIQFPFYGMPQIGCRQWRERYHISLTRHIQRSKLLDRPGYMLIKWIHIEYLMGKHTVGNTVEMMLFFDKSKCIPATAVYIMGLHHHETVSRESHTPLGIDMIDKETHPSLMHGRIEYHHISYLYLA